MRSKTIYLGFRLAIALVILIAASGSVIGQNSEPLALSLGYSVWVGYGPLFIAADQGYFAEEGLDVTLVNVENPGDRFTAMAGNQLNGLVSTLDTMAQYCNADNPFKTVLALDESSGGDGIVTSPDITSIEDLRGKSIGVNIGSVSQFFLEYIMQENGLTDDDVSLIRMSQGDVPAALASDRIDAGVTWEPHLSTSVSNGANLLVDSSTTPGLIVDILVLRQDIIDEHPEATQGLINAWNKSIEFWKANPDEAATIMAEGLGSFYETADDINADLGGVTLYDAEANHTFFSGTDEGSALGTLNFALEFYTASGVITDPCAPEDMIDSSFVVPEGMAEATAEATEAS
jgi:NitT/TauT family transport system substrate-binding protein